jgi:glutathione synthase
MAIKVAIQMNHISSISIAGDSGFALMLEAQARGHELYHYTPDRLAMSGNSVFCALEPVTVRDEPGNHFTLGEKQRMNLEQMDVILMRQDPPFDLAYIAASHILEKIHPKTLVVNNPVTVRNAPEKLFVTEFSDLMPPTMITRDLSEIALFRAEFGDIVMKPLFGHGGAGVFRISRDDLNYGSLCDFFAATFREPWVIQQFLPNVKHGDKRILLVDGEFAGAVNRVPSEGDLRANMVRGGIPTAADLTPKEREICRRIGPTLSAKGLILVGIDVIDDKITEINVTAPTGLRAIKKLGGPDAAAKVWDVLEAKLG